MVIGWKRWLVDPGIGVAVGKRDTCAKGGWVEWFGGCVAIAIRAKRKYSAGKSFRRD